jgi:hypothetical protein
MAETRLIPNTMMLRNRAPRNRAFLALYLPLLLRGSLPLLREYHARAAACACAMTRWNAMTGARSEYCTIGQLRDCGVK